MCSAEIGNQPFFDELVAGAAFGYEVLDPGVVREKPRSVDQTPILRFRDMLF